MNNFGEYESKQPFNNAHNTLGVIIMLFDNCSKNYTVYNEQYINFKKLPNNWRFARWFFDSFKQTIISLLKFSICSEKWDLFHILSTKMLLKHIIFTTTIVFSISGSVYAKTLIDIDFNDGFDNFENSQGTLVFNGTGGLQVSFTDDNSSGAGAGNADGVHITNQNYGNIKVGSDDLVIGAYNSYNGQNNYHSSGIVATFSYGIELVSFLDTDNDYTKKTLFAFDKESNLIGSNSRL